MSLTLNSKSSLTPKLSIHGGGLYRKTMLVYDIVVIETADVYNWTYLDDYGVQAAHGDNLLFKVRASSGVHVALARLGLCQFRHFSHVITICKSTIKYKN